MYQIFAHDLEQSFSVFNHPPSSSAHHTAEFNKNQRIMNVGIRFTYLERDARHSPRD